MGVPNFYYKHTPKGGTTTNTYYDFESITIKRSMEAKASLIEIGIPNRFGKFSGLSTNS